MGEGGSYLWAPDNTYCIICYKPEESPILVALKNEKGSMRRRGTN